MKMLTTACALLLAFAPPGSAQTQDPFPGRELAELIYGSIDNGSDNAADIGAFVSFGQDIFVSMDADTSGSIDLGEFMDWDFGFDFIARDQGQERAYHTAQRIIFANWDHNGDGQIGHREYHKSMVWDFRRADTDDDALLTRAEFLKGYVINLAYRAALTGQ